MARSVEAAVTNDPVLSMLVDWFMEAEERSVDSRQLSEKDRDYKDNIQWTDEEIVELEKRKQPVTTINRIKRKVDFLVGNEIQTRTDPKAFPRTPAHEGAAHAATDSIRFVCDNNDYNSIRSENWENIIVEGACGVVVGGRQNGQEVEITQKRVAWDRLFWDPHSSEADFSDARYKGIVIWMDEAHAVAKYPKAKEIIKTTMQSSTTAQTYDDKPKFTVWADSKRKRVRIVEIHWDAPREGWKSAKFTKAGFVEQPAISPYLDEDGDPECELLMMSAHIDRENNRYGAVREMISPQDEVNKRRSKSLHLLSVRQVIASKGAVDDPRKAQNELAKPDGFVEINDPDARFDIQPLGDMAAGHFNLLAEAKSEIDGMGPNSSLAGKQEQELSGRALALQQQGGIVELGRLNERRRTLDRNVYRATFNRIRQFWKAEKWVRVTDDENNLKFVGLNRPVTAGEMFRERLQEEGLPPEQIEQAMAELQGDPRADQIVRTDNEVAELDVDIIVSEVPDTVSIQTEEFKLIADMVQAGMQIPPHLVIKASNLRNKDEIIAEMTGGTPEAQQAQQAQSEFEQRAATAEIEKTEAETQRLKAQTAESLAKAADIADGEVPDIEKEDPAPTPLQLQKEALENAEINAKIEVLRATVAEKLANAKAKIVDASATAKEAQVPNVTNLNVTVPGNPTRKLTFTRDGEGNLSGAESS